MPEIRIVTLAGSIRQGSHNQRLADLVGRHLATAGASITPLSLRDHELPLYDAAIEIENGIPTAAKELHRQFATHHAIFLASPEYNASVSPLLANALAWISRVRDDGGIPAAFGRPVFAIGAAAPGAMGGYRGLIALRHLLELGLSARVLPAMISVPGAAEAYDEAGELKGERARGSLDVVIQRLMYAVQPVS